MIRTKYIEKRRTPNLLVEKEAEFQEDITSQFYTIYEIRKKYSKYKFPEFIGDFKEEFNCKLKCDIKYYLHICTERSGYSYGSFLSASLDISDHGEPTFLALYSFEEGRNRTEIANQMLQDEVCTKVMIKACMDIKFFLFASLNALPEYGRVQLEDNTEPSQPVETPRVQLEYHYLYVDDGYQEDTEPSLPVETPFVTNTCSICLLEDPNIIIFPCLHQSVCLQCENKGKLTRCPTCRELIVRKVKI